MSRDSLAAVAFGVALAYMPACSEFNEEELNREVSRSVKKIRSLGVLHGVLRPDNILWNTELRGP